MKPDVSIIIINYNKPELTKDCIQSIIERTKGVNYEVIVVDNASTEGDIELIYSLNKPLKLIKSPDNLGFAKGNNLGISYATADAISLLNNDTVLINDAITLAYNKLYSSSSIGVVGGQLQYPDGELQKSAQRFPEISYLCIELFRLQKLLSRQKAGRLLLGNFFDHNEEVKADWIWGTFFMFKKEVLQKLKDQKLPEDFFMYNEDLQWGIEIKKTGYETVFYPEVKVIHFEGKNKFKNRMVEENFEIIMNRYYGSLYHKLFKNFYKLVVFSSQISKKK